MFVYDVFISYSSRDKEWVRSDLLHRIEEKGYRAFIDFRDFKPGAPAIKEMERGLMTCRKTLLVLTPAYLESEWYEIETMMLQVLSPANKDLRMIPLLKSECEKPLSMKGLTHIDFTASADLDLAWTQLIETLLTTIGAPRAVLMNNSQSKRDVGMRQGHAETSRPPIWATNQEPAESV